MRTCDLCRALEGTSMACPCHCHAMAGELRTENAALKATVEELERERDLAIAHDRQPYPTAHAYETLCRAHWALRHQLAQATDALRRWLACSAAGFHLPGGPGVSDAIKQAAAALAAISEPTTEPAPDLWTSGIGLLTLAETHLRETKPNTAEAIRHWLEKAGIGTTESGGEGGRGG